MNVCSADRTVEEIERTKQFGKEVVDLLRHQPHCRMLFNKFIPTYHHHFGRQCKLSYYGFTKLMELFEAIPDILMVSSGDCWHGIISTFLCFCNMFKLHFCLLLSCLLFHVVFLHAFYLDEFNLHTFLLRLLCLGAGVWWGEGVDSDRSGAHQGSGSSAGQAAPCSEKLQPSCRPAAHRI